MTVNNKEETIIALATPPGIGAIAVIRISGSESINAIDHIFSGKQRVKDAKSHTIQYGKIKDQDEIIDDVLISVFRAPNSYTGEDSIEISSHGSPLIVNRIISLILEKSNSRLAEPGEFTKRAFLNNRIDLTQAEAVADLINSRTSVSLRGFRNQLDGLLSSRVSWLRRKLIEATSFIELELDFAEENIEFTSRNELGDRINEILQEIKFLLQSYNYGKVIREGVNVAIIGEPNVGKSSLLNYLLKESRSIVSEIPGTTRDIIREEISIDGLLFKLYDTAGIRISEDKLEQEGVERSREVMRKADLILFIGDVNAGFSNLIATEIPSLNPNARIIKVLNKIDLDAEKKFTEDIRISAINGEGIIQLLNILKNVAYKEGAYTEKAAIVTNLRHYNCLRKAEENIIKSIKTLQANLSGEFLASDLRATESALAEIVGDITSEDVLNNIFSKFCIGK
ncbi:MAG: tRNA uridine-5-carboxymethylaminomethyl(34) synthesis GTPase MnmE [Ignavibacteriaceae bacterium]|nr:tRNA uridine-5-carboxymethylaminomethyl(34) synthesis GTPase MnmE [Ignavibacteriaceae bacterium]